MEKVKKNEEKSKVKRSEVETTIGPPNSDQITDDNLKSMVDIATDIITHPHSDFSHLGSRLDELENKLTRLESIFTSNVNNSSHPDPDTPITQTYSSNESNDLVNKGSIESILRINNSEPLLKQIKPDYLTMVLVMRWLEFMFQQVTRQNFIVLLDYYKEIGWISTEVKSQLMLIARGTMQDVINFEPLDSGTEEVISPIETKTKISSDYKKVGDWRLSAEDHLKSLLFIKKIGGDDVDKDTLNSLEYEIGKFKQNLHSFYEI